MSETAAVAACEQHQEPSTGTCPRCGRFFCARCRGEPPNDDHCAACDRVLGFLPFEARGDRGSFLSAWYATYLAIVSDPADALRRFPREGPLDRALVFATVSILVHLSVLSLLALALQSMRADVFDLAQPRIDVASGVVVFLGNLTMLGVRVALAIAVVFVVGAICRSLSLRAVVRTVAYGTAYLVLATIPIAGLVALFRGPRFLIGAAAPQGGPVMRGALGLGLVTLWLAVPRGLMSPVQQLFWRLMP